MAGNQNPYVWQLPVDLPADGPPNGQILRLIFQSLQNWISGLTTLPVFFKGLTVGNGTPPTFDPATGRQTADAPLTPVVASSRGGLTVGGQTLGAIAPNTARTGTTPPAGTQLLVQSGSTSGTVDASSNQTITFQAPFSNGLIAFVPSNGDGGANPKMYLETTSTILSTATVRWWLASGVGLALGSAVRCDWVAVGW